MGTESNGKILMVVPGGSFFTDPFRRSFERAGYECEVFDYRQGAVFTNNILRRALSRFAFLRFLKRWRIMKTNRSLLAFVRENKPEYMFAQKGEHIYPETILEIRKLGVVTMNFYNDQMNQWSVISKIAPAYDYFFNECHLVLRRLWDELGLKNCYYLAHAAEPLPENVLVKNKKYPIAFIGTHNNELYPKRERYLRALGDLGLNIWGSAGWENTPLKGCYHGRARGEDRLEIYANSKIVVDINYEFIAAEGVNNRPFEVAGCGSMLLTDYVRKDLAREYTSGVEVVQFKDEIELREKAIYYLAHEAERVKISLAGYRRTAADHTYDKRVTQMFDTMKNPEKYLYQ